jgi:hypothetical protein
MKIIGDTQIVRTWKNVTWDGDGRRNEFEDEFEIPVAYNVEELYKGTNDTDDPSECKINERVKVLEDIGPFRIGDMLVLTDDERDDIEQEEIQQIL